MRSLKVMVVVAAIIGYGWAETKPAVYTSLSFGIIATESAVNLKRGFDPFLAALSEKIGMPVKGYFATDYAAAIEAMRFGKIQLAWLGNKSAIEAVDRADGEIFAQTTGINGETGYQSVVIVNKQSGLNSIDDILARHSELVFGTGDPNSTSGTLIPGFYLWSKRGVNIQTHFKMTRAANHEVNIMAVARGHVDFATNNTEMLERFEKTNPQLLAKVKVIWTSPMIPKDPLVYRSDLPSPLKTKIAAAFLGFGTLGTAEQQRRERDLLAKVSTGWGTFLVSDNSQIIPVRQLELEQERLMVLDSCGAKRRKDCWHLYFTYYV
jgi:phosphonate transport system substrate-binding protein